MANRRTDSGRFRLAVPESLKRLLHKAPQRRTSRKPRTRKNRRVGRTLRLDPRDHQATGQATGRAAGQTTGRAAGRGASSVAAGGRQALKQALKQTLVALAWALPFVVAVGAFVTPLLGVQAYDYVMHSGHFHVRQVDVKGQRVMPLEQIEALAGIAPGTNVLGADLDAMSARLVAHPWIASATVTRELPDRLMVSVKEHRPTAWVALGEMALVDAQGFPFATGADAAAVGFLDTEGALPIITGLDLDVFDTQGSMLVAAERIRAAVNVHRLYRSMDLDVRWPVAEYRLDSRHGLSLVLSETGTEVIVGRGPYRDKLFRLEWVLESLRADGKTAEYVVLDTLGDHRVSADGRVIVRADIAPSRQHLMDQAAERARAAERQLLGLPTDPDLFGPAISPSGGSLGGADEGPTATELDDAARRQSLRALTGGRPAVKPADVVDDKIGED